MRQIHYGSKALFCLLFWSAVAQYAVDAAAPAVGVAQNASSVGRYDLYELTLTNSDSYSNPWEDVAITAVFTAPSARKYTVGGFYFDTGTWKVRFNSDWNGYDAGFGNWFSYGTDANGPPQDGMSTSGNVGLGPYSAIILSQD